MANIMSVLERRSEIRLCRARGATRSDIRVRLLAESCLLSSAEPRASVQELSPPPIYVATKHELVVIPSLAWAGRIGSVILIGAAAGLWTAHRGARMSPAPVHWSV